MRTQHQEAGNEHAQYVSRDAIAGSMKGTCAKGTPSGLRRGALLTPRARRAHCRCARPARRATAAPSAPAELKLTAPRRSHDLAKRSFGLTAATLGAARRF